MIQTQENKIKLTRLRLCLVLFFSLSLVMYLLPVPLFYWFIKLGLILMDRYSTLYILGLALIVMGILIPLFWLRLLLKRTPSQFSGIKISAKEEPHLYKFIQKLCAILSTRVTRKIYLSSNGSPQLFFSSHFFHCFWPATKELVIGLAHLNTLTSEETKALIVRELAYLSPENPYYRYTYLYQILYNQYYNPPDIEEISDKWIARSFFLTKVIGPVIVITELLFKGVFFVQKKMLRYITNSYTPIGQFVEQKIDAIAAQHVGAEALKSGILRADLAEFSFQVILQLCKEQAMNGLKPLNLYPLQTIVLKYLAHHHRLRLINGSPTLEPIDHPRFTTTNLLINNQWRWHKAIKDRMDSLSSLSSLEEKQESTPLKISQLNIWQEKITLQLIQEANYLADIEEYAHEWIEEWIIELYQNPFPTLFNNYYDQHDPALLPITQVIQAESTFLKGKTAAELFSRAQVNKVFEISKLENDLACLRQIWNGELEVVTFNLNGRKYQKEDAEAVIGQTEDLLIQYKAEIEAFDLQVLDYFFKLSKLLVQAEYFTTCYKQYLHIHQTHASSIHFSETLIEHTRFVFERCSIALIESRLTEFLPLEQKFKSQLNGLLTDQLFTSILRPEVIVKIKQYAAQTWEYFDGKNYNNHALELVLTAIYAYQEFLNFIPGYVKNELLNCMMVLEEEKVRVVYS